MKLKTYLILVILSLLFVSCGGGGGGGSSSTNTAPPAPENILSTGGNAQVRLSWRNAGGATTYNIYWSTTAGVLKNTGTKISAATSPYYQSGLTDGTTYYYVVTAENQYGESIESSEVSATPSITTPPLPPSDVATLSGDRQATISWDADINAATYNIYWSTSVDLSSKNGMKIADVTSPYAHTGLQQDTVYYYVVTACNGYGESADSDKASVTILDSLKDLCVAMGDSITNSWGLNNIADGYVSVLSGLWGKTVVANGVDGTLSAYGAAIIDGILDRDNPRYLTIYYGTNDVSIYSPDGTIDNLRNIIEKAKANGTIPVIATLTPNFGSFAWRNTDIYKLNEKIRQLAASQGIACADLEYAVSWNSDFFLSDGMHPNSAGHRIIANAFYSTLTR